ncbi:MAG: energy transducer TonB [Chitinophagaceae bacterium]|nr:energy transducer TonB [Chitinophagaceae bacterium]
MKTKNFFSEWFANDLDEIIFEGRNKLYGAYELRRSYPERLKQAFIIALLFCFTLWTVMELSLSKHKSIVVPSSSGDIPYITNPGFSEDKKQQVQKEERSSLSPKEKLPTSIVADTAQAEKKDTDTTSHAKDSGEGKADSLGIGSSNNGTGGSVNGIGSGEGKGSDTAGKKIDAEEVISTPAVMPYFPGGKNALSRYLQIHLKCQQFRSSNAKGGKMYVSFIVSREGKVYDAQIMRDGVGYGCVQEAVMVLQNMPKWIPGTDNNRAVNVKVIMPISMETTTE